MPEPFVIFPSEAVLMGLAVGEFVELRKLGIDDSFDDVLYRRVHPFVPDLAVPVKTRIPTPDWLDAIWWWRDENAFGTLDANEERGDHWFCALPPKDDSSADEVQKYEEKVARYKEAAARLGKWLREQPSPETLIEFARIGGEYYRVDKDESQESLLDLVVRYLTTNDPKPRKRWNERDSLRERYRVDASGPKAHHRTPEEVSQKIAELAQSNNLAEYFKLGKILGGAFADCVAAEPLLLHIEATYAASIDEESGHTLPSTEDEDGLVPYLLTWRRFKLENDQVPSAELQDKLFQQSWGRFLDAIKADSVFNRLELTSHGFLERLTGYKMIIGHGYFGFREEQYPDWEMRVLANAFCMRTALSMILEYVLGDLRHADAEAITRNQNSASPRHFAENNPVRNLASIKSIRRQGDQLLMLCQQIWPGVQPDQILQQARRSMGEASLYERDFAKHASRLLGTYHAAVEPARASTFRLFEDDQHFRILMPELQALCRRIIDERNRNGQELSELVEGGEGQNVEFKSSARWNLRANKPDPVIEREVKTTIGAFLNSDGGNLLIGIADDGTILGLADDFKTLGKHQNRDGFENWLMNKAVTACYGNAACQFVRVRLHNVEGNYVCQVTVHPAPEPCYLRDGRTAELWVRRGNATVLLDAEQTVSYVRNHWK